MPGEEMRVGRGFDPDEPRKAGAAMDAQDALDGSRRTTKRSWTALFRRDGRSVDPHEQHAAVRWDQSLTLEQQPVREASQLGRRYPDLAEDMDLTSELGGSLSSARSMPEEVPFSEEGEDHRRWLVNHQRNEIVFWNAKAEELEQQLRRRTAVLVTLLTCAVLSAVAAAGILFVQLAASRAPDQVGIAPPLRSRKLACHYPPRRCGRRQPGLAISRLLGWNMI